MRTDSTYDTATRALFAIAEVADPYGAGASKDGVPLAPGLFVDADISGKSFDNVITIPRAVLTGGVEVGELVVLSPMERSRTEMTLKVLDVNDPETVLVDPPKPEWMKKREAEDGKSDADGDAKDKKEKRRWGKKKKDDESAGGEDKADDTAKANNTKATED